MSWAQKNDKCERMTTTITPRECIDSDNTYNFKQFKTFFAVVARASLKSLPVLCGF